MSRSFFSAEPEVWPNTTPEEFARVEEAVRRLSAVSKTVGYWTPIGKVVEALIYAHEPGELERNLIARSRHPSPVGTPPGLAPLLT
jgi:hypothetical protein